MDNIEGLPIRAVKLLEPNVLYRIDAECEKCGYETYFECIYVPATYTSFTPPQPYKAVTVCRDCDFTSMIMSKVVFIQRDVLPAAYVREGGK